MHNKIEYVYEYIFLPKLGDSVRKFVLSSHFVGNKSIVTHYELHQR